MPPKASKPKAAKAAKAAAVVEKAPPEPKNLPWTDTMQLTLLKLVQITGAHVHGGKKSTAAWNEVYKQFFDQEELSPFRAKHYNPALEGKEAWRKLRDKYNLIMETVQRDIATGNLSGREGDLSPIYKYVEQISMEMEDAVEKADASKEAKKADQTLLNNNETNLLGAMAAGTNGTKKRANDNSSIRTKNADGSITVDTEREAKKASRVQNNSLEAKLLSFMENKDKEKELQSPKVVAANLLVLMKSFVPTVTPLSGIVSCDTTFLENAFRQLINKPPPDYLHEVFENMGGINAIIDFFCQKDTIEIGAKCFVEILESMDIKVKEARTLYRYMCELKLEAEAKQLSDKLLAAANSKRLPSVVGTPSSASSDLTAEATTVMMPHQQLAQQQQQEEEYVPLPYALYNQYGEEDEQYKNLGHLEDLIMLAIP